MVNFDQAGIIKTPYTAWQQYTALPPNPPTRLAFNVSNVDDESGRDCALCVAWQRGWAGMQ